MGLADKLMGMNFTPPGDYKADPEEKTESDSEESAETMTREDLGNAFKDAIDSGSGAAIFEAIRKIIDTPDAE